MNTAVAMSSVCMQCDCQFPPCGGGGGGPGTGYAEEKPGARPRLPGRRRADTGRREELPQSVARVQPSRAGRDIYRYLHNIYIYLEISRHSEHSVIGDSCYEVCST